MVHIEVHFKRKLFHDVGIPGTLVDHFLSQCGANEGYGTALVVKESLDERSVPRIIRHQKWVFSRYNLFKKGVRLAVYVAR